LSKTEREAVESGQELEVDGVEGGTEAEDTEDGNLSREPWLVLDRGGEGAE
jgi:hypothetical protein